MPGRPRKTIEQKLLEGTYQKCRDPDPAALARITNLLTDIDCPKTIRDRKTKEAWEITVRPLCLPGRVSAEDVPILELAHLALQDVYLCRKRVARLQRCTEWELSPDHTDQVSKLTRLVSRRTEDYRRIMCLFGVTPIERTRILSGGGHASKKSLTERLLT